MPILRLLVIMMLDQGYGFEKYMLGTLLFCPANFLKHNRLCFKGCHCVSKCINQSEGSNSISLLTYPFSGIAKMA